MPGLSAFLFTCIFILFPYTTMVSYPASFTQEIRSFSIFLSLIVRPAPGSCLTVLVPTAVPSLAFSMFLQFSHQTQKYFALFHLLPDGLYVWWFQLRGWMMRILWQWNVVVSCLTTRQNTIERQYLRDVQPVQLHTLLVKKQIHTKCLIKHQYIVEKQ